jgi:radical SAM protein with 4Fe4S-binding SPASM domain
MAIIDRTPDGRPVPYFPLKLAALYGADGEWEAFNPVEGAAYRFNPAAAYLLRLCDGCHTEDDVVAAIAEAYVLDPATARSRAVAVLRPLTEAGMVWWRPQIVEAKPLPPPVSVFWELTWRCNLRCIHCVVSAGDREEDGDEPTTTQLKGIAWQLARAGVRSVTYSGGEPLSRPDFFAIADHVAALGLSAQIATNGLLVTEEVARRLAQLRIETQITLNASTAASHDAFTGVRGSWEKSVRAIKLLLAAGVQVTVATIATTRSVPDVPAIVDLAAGLGAPVYRLIPFVPGGRGRSHRELELSPMQMRELTLQLRDIRSQGRIGVLPLEFEETLDPAPPYPCAADTRIGCDGAVGYCTIGATGEVLPCSFFSGVAADSLRDRPFEWIWRNSRFLNYFRSLNVSDLEGVCVSCDHLAACRGGCRATNRNLGAMFAANAHCWLAV